MHELAIVLAVALSGQFDASDAGVGARFGWRPIPAMAIEAELVRYPAEFGEPVPFSRARTEVLVGAAAGPRLGRIRPFVRLRSGVLAVGEAPEPFPCIQIFPPPLTCELASGRNLPAVDVGGGVEFAASDRTFVRLDLGDRLVRYPAPVFDGDRAPRFDPFWGHDARLTLSGGVTF